MTWKIIVADFTGALEWEPLIARLSHLQNEISFVYSTSSEDLLLHLNSPEAVSLVVAAPEFSSEVENAYRQYQQIVGCLPEFLALICDEPSPRFVVSIFEFGVENIIRKEHILDRFETLAQVIKTTLSDESSPEFHAINLALGLKTSNQARIQNAGAAMKAIAGEDYRAAYVAGRALEAQGVYGEAEQAYKLAYGINKMFRPGSSSLAEALMVTGKVDEAVAILEKMEKSNPRDISRKSTLIAAYTEQGQTEKAAKALAEAAALAPDHPKLVEAKVNIMLAEGKIAEAFNLMPQMENAGVLFASRLNDMGIRLSKEGKAKQALALYNKAHKIVRQDLRYKLSMNCALACRRLGDFEMALKYLARCKKEFGKSFDKLDQIIVATKLAIEQQKGTQAS
jgi:tetratricopeptide (TPR) repeat protein